jgi:Protein of unknown function (DUF1640)
MTSLAFDTHASVKKLKEAGFTEQQAEAQVQVFSEIIESNLATKQDLKEVEIALKQDSASLKRDIELLCAENKCDLAETKGEIIRWMAGFIIGAVVAMTGIFATILKLMLPG